jgi:hypothetical protein
LYLKYSQIVTLAKQSPLEPEKSGRYAKEKEKKKERKIMMIRLEK